MGNFKLFKQKDVVNLIEGSISESKKKFGRPRYNCNIKKDIVYSKEPFILLSQNKWSFIGNV